ncbi:MAG: 3-dehydroquinate synthetase [Pseudobdellovibrio sp.]|jgi:3-dehydroquinate synthetase|nr:3-dehydroquinate synthetase [Pseudobdellovibrio sp.]
MPRPVVYLPKLPSRTLFPAECVLFYDSVLASKAAFKKWAAKFEHSIALKSGESLKTVDSFNQVLKKITKQNISQTTQLTFVSVGGGSVGDFVGFLASVYLRGRGLIHIPSTWLSAVDSAHGGKNGLNFEGVKNQVGTFYPPEKVYVCRELLNTQPAERLCEAMGEVVKTAVLFDKKLFADLEKQNKPYSNSQIWQRLENLVAHKYAIVEKDPNEKLGLRRLLNLGHTMGHVFEAHYGWAHGVCVLLGLEFAAAWSHQLRILNKTDYARIVKMVKKMKTGRSLTEALSGLNEKKVLSLLQKDKKLTGDSTLDFIFVKSIGNCIRKKVSLNEIAAEFKRQKAL